MYFHHTLEQIADDKFLDTLEYCLCGKELKGIAAYDPHEICMKSGILRGKFKDRKEWIEYCRWNGARVAEGYRLSMAERHLSRPSLSK